MKDETLASMGTILQKDMPRDAVHIACAAVLASCRLLPGQHIGLLPDGRATTGIEACGIVDPYLRQTIEEGERFWLFLYPGSITSLKHLWTHPAFAADQVAPAKDKATSEAWLRDFIKNADCPDYETVMAAIDGTLEGNPSPEDYGPAWGRYDGEALFFSGRDAHSSIPIEFWDHAEIVLGKRLRHKPEHFACSC